MARGGGVWVTAVVVVGSNEWNVKLYGMEEKRRKTRTRRERYGIGAILALEVMDGHRSGDGCEEAKNKTEGTTSRRRGRWRRRRTN